MIVDTMSFIELEEHLLNRKKIIMPLLERMMKAKDKDYRRIVYKSQKDRIDFKPLYLKNDEIEFYVCVYSLGKNDYRKFGPNFTLFAHFFYKKTNWYAHFVDKLSTINFYSQHFFKRYIERHLKDDSEVTSEIVRRYFKEIDNMTYICSIENLKYENCMYGGTHIGVSCGESIKKMCGEEIIGQVVVFKTYIDNETLTRGEKDRTYKVSQEAFQHVVMGELGYNELKL